MMSAPIVPPGADAEVPMNQGAMALSESPPHNQGATPPPRPPLPRPDYKAMISSVIENAKTEIEAVTAAGWADCLPPAASDQDAGRRVHTASKLRTPTKVTPKKRVRDISQSRETAL